MATPQPNEIVDATTGQTLYLNPYRGTYTQSRSYALRMQRGYARGISQQQARRNVSGVGPPEHIVRRQRFIERFGTGITEDEWRRMRRQYPDIDRINALSASSITPEMILQAQQLIGQGYLPQDWIEVRLNNKLYAMRQYRRGNRYQGAVYFDERIEYVSIEWWYYH